MPNSSTSSRFDRKALIGDLDEPTRYGPYTIERQIGQGGCAAVFLARDDQDVQVAVKRPLPEWNPSAMNVHMLVHEARIGALVDHPNVARTLDFGRDGDHVQLILEYVDGVSLRQLIQSSRCRHAPFSTQTVLHLGCELLRALEHIHSRATDETPGGIIHRDISPANILVSRKGHVKLADFGVASSAERHGRRHGYAVGKVGYMAPEQVLGKDVDHRCDLFAVAAVLIELLLLKKAFAGETSTEVLYNCTRGDLSVLERHGSHVPKAVVEVLTTALGVEPSSRFESAEAMRQALQGALARPPRSACRRDLAKAVRLVASEQAARLVRARGGDTESIPPTRILCMEHLKRSVRRAVDRRGMVAPGKQPARALP